MTDRPGGGTVVIGLGNPLMADDGLGLAALEALRHGWTFEPHVELVDGGTWGMNLLYLIEDADRVLLLDAINVEAPPGDVVELERDALPRMFGLKISPHQIDMREVLALAQLRDTLPREIVAMGLQPERVEMSTEVTPALRAALPALTERALARLAAWGHHSRARSTAVRA